MQAARLRRSADITLAREEGRSVRGVAFALRARPNGMDVVRIAVSAPRMVGGGVQRNRARRRLREAFRIAVAGRKAGLGADLLVTARREALDTEFARLRGGARDALEAAMGPDT